MNRIDGAAMSGGIGSGVLTEWFWNSLLLGIWPSVPEMTPAVAVCVAAGVVSVLKR